MKLRRTHFGVSIGGGAVAKFLGTIGRTDEGFVFFGSALESGGVCSLEEALFGEGVVTTVWEGGDEGYCWSLGEGGFGGSGGAPSSSRGGIVGFTVLIRDAAS